jgi:hypothetical protein
MSRHGVALLFKKDFHSTESGAQTISEQMTGVLNALLTEASKHPGQDIKITVETKDHEEGEMCMFFNMLVQSPAADEPSK